MLNDIRYALRVLVKSPAFTSVAALSLALDIGGGVFVFTLLNAITLRELPVANPQQLYAAEIHRTNEVANRYSWATFVQVRQNCRNALRHLSRPTRQRCRCGCRAAPMWPRPSEAWCNWCRASSSMCCGNERSSVG